MQTLAILGVWKHFNYKINVITELNETCRYLQNIKKDYNKIQLHCFTLENNNRKF